MNKELIESLSPETLQKTVFDLQDCLFKKKKKEDAISLLSARVHFIINKYREFQLKLY